MPISTNAPFNEFGQSQILRDIEQLYLALNGAGSGGPGDGQTQDQSSATSQDLSALATIEYVDAAIGAIPSVSYPVSIANGGTASTTAGEALSNLGAVFSHGNRTAYTSGTNTYTVPAGVYSIYVDLIGAGGGGGYTSYTPVTYNVDEGGVLNARPISTSAQAQQGGCGGRMYLLLRVTPGEQFSVVIGSGGAAGTSGTPTGGTGGDTTFSKSSGPTLLAKATGGGGGVGTLTKSSNNAGGFGMYSSANIDRDFWAVSIKGNTGAQAVGSTLPAGTGWDMSQPQSTGHCPLGLDGSTLYGGGGDGRMVSAGSAGTAAAAGQSGYATIFY